MSDQVLLAGADPAAVSVRSRTDWWLNVVVLALWFAVVVTLVSRHVMWRDEVRALSLALNGDTFVAMLRGVHGEGHPALWYLLLRAAHTIIGQPEVLPGVALMVAVAAALLLLFRSPFPLPMKCLILLGHFFIYEFSVNARNYGISMLVLFALAASYRTHRGRGLVLGCLLFLLVNCNVHSVIIGFGFLLFWLIDIVQETGVRWSRSLTNFLINAAIALLGVALCALTIFPTYNDAGLRDWPDATVLRTVFDPAATFHDLLAPWADAADPWAPALEAGGSALLFGCTFGLLSRLGALVAGLATLIGLSIFFTFGVTGGYRHQALWLVFLISLYWITWETKRGFDAGSPGAAMLGFVLFVVVLGIQAVVGAIDVRRAEQGFPPSGRAADFAAFMAGRPELRDATVIADPDYLVESLPYYIANKTYLMRQQEYGNVVRFSRQSKLDLELADIPRAAMTIRETTGKPVVILLMQSLGDNFAPAHIYHESYDWTLLTTPQQIRSFRDNTLLLNRFGQAMTDESYDAYLLR